MSDALQLLEAYVALAGGAIEYPEEGLLRFSPSEEDRPWFRGASRLLALDPESMDLHPDAEVVIVGSRFVEDLLAAIRARGSRLDRGYLDPGGEVLPEQALPALSLRRGSVVDVAVATRWIPYGRLHAAASVRISHEVQDRLVSTGFFDLTSGRALLQSLSEAATESLAETPARTDPGNHDVASARPLVELLPAMLGDVEDGLADTLAAAEAEAERSLKRELGRLEKYYGEMIADERRRRAPSSEDAIRAYQGDLQRRKNEEISRNQARVDLRPTQLEVFHALAQQVEFTLHDHAHAGVVTGHRLLLGDSQWAIACPNCQAGPEAWAVCTGGHVLCSSCSTACSTCGGTSCRAHGGGSCSGGTAPVHPLCADHLMDCPSCDRGHCAEHAGVCSTNGHAACLDCMRDCEVCGSQVCEAHSAETTPGIFIPGEEIPAQQARTLCPECVRHCRGLKDEVRGRDEVETCQTCGDSVCHEHADVCDVTRDIHCATHLTRTDRSRRLVNPRDKARCEDEPDLLFASDEVDDCSECGRTVCRDHRAPCYADGATFCTGHVVGLRNGEYACSEHHGLCVVDGSAEKSEALSPCPVCDSPACLQHSAECKSCGVVVCNNDYETKPGVCRTCDGLTVVDQPDDALLEALVELLPDASPAVRWETGRDATRRVGRATLSRWGKSVTFALDHGSAFASSAIQHGLVLTKRLR